MLRGIPFKIVFTWLAVVWFLLTVTLRLYTPEVKLNHMKQLMYAFMAALGSTVLLAIFLFILTVVFN